MCKEGKREKGKRRRLGLAGSAPTAGGTVLGGKPLLGHMVPGLRCALGRALLGQPGTR